jgi:hypothetical protein
VHRILQLYKCKERHNPFESQSTLMQLTKYELLHTHVPGEAPAFP